ncbi:hypothetical protein GCM10008939_25370 [Deinococcus aquiradiocola]|uniref:Uncharacterized protein n=1 Tax=Deinococcus aquiradiocola TaxID=393059 RepID=A0A917PIT5_9DEIO|nr:hypothetical protein GCM10008939_25370 [Deinococcus aquiradiocola]
MKRLLSSGTLGSAQSAEEVQIARPLVWIVIPAYGRRADWLQRGDDLSGESWREGDRVVAFARQQSRAMLPDFWAAHDQAGISDEQLAVWGIWISPGHAEPRPSRPAVPRCVLW